MERDIEEINYKSDKSLADSSAEEELETQGGGYFGRGTIYFNS
jgi:hypothetical protein